MTYPKFGATFFDLGLQLPRQILTKSKKFQNSKIFMENSYSFIKQKFPPKNFGFWKEYFPNLLEITLLPRFFVYWARYFKFWLLAYFLILLNCAKFEKDWTTFILHILQGSPLWIFGKLQKQKNIKGGTLVKCVM